MEVTLNTCGENVPFFMILSVTQQIRHPISFCSVTQKFLAPKTPSRSYMPLNRSDNRDPISIPSVTQEIWHPRPHLGLVGHSTALTHESLSRFLFSALCNSSMTNSSWDSSCLKQTYNYTSDNRFGQMEHFRWSPYYRRISRACQRAWRWLGLDQSGDSRREPELPLPHNQREVGTCRRLPNYLSMTISKKD